MSRNARFAALVALFVLFAALPGPAQAGPGLEAARSALEKALAESGAAKGAKDILILTNAPSVRLDGDSAVAFLDTARDVAGVSIGARSLLPVHSSMLAPFWFSVYDAASGTLIYAMHKDGAFASQKIDARPEAIFTPENWKTASTGLIGGSIFSVVSISLAWAVHPDYISLAAASFHDHFCPGVNYGLIIGDYIEKNLPLGPGDAYVFAVAPSRCAADALQVMYNTTTGKGGDYGMAISDADAAKYATNGIAPTAVVMRVNKKNDVCEAVAFGIDSKRLYADIKLDEAGLSPQGGPQNPVYFITRTKAARELCRLPKEQRMGYVVELARTSGKAALAEQVTANDPYAHVFGK